MNLAVACIMSTHTEAHIANFIATCIKYSVSTCVKLILLFFELYFPLHLNAGLQESWGTGPLQPKTPVLPETAGLYWQGDCGDHHVAAGHPCSSQSPALRHAEQSGCLSSH